MDKGDRVADKHNKGNLLFLNPPWPSSRHLARPSGH